MRTRVLTILAIVPALVVTAGAKTAQGLMIAAPNPMQRAVTAPIVVVGKVTSIEADPVDAEPFPKAPQKVSYKIALIKIDEALVGAKGLTHIKVGFLPPPPPPPADPNVPRLGRPRMGFDLSLKLDQEGCFFLKKHPTGNFYTFDYMSQPLNKSAENYKEELETTKRAIAVVANPMKSLKAEKAEDRYVAAAALLSKYRNPPQGTPNPTQVDISAEETKLIFKALLEHDWSKFEQNVPNPNMLISMSGVMGQNGFQPGRFSGKGDYNAFLKGEFQKWVAGPGAKYTIKKFAEPESK